MDEEKTNQLVTQLKKKFWQFSTHPIKIKLDFYLNCKQTLNNYTIKTQFERLR